MDNNKDVWIRDLQNNIDSRLTFDTGEEVQPAWFPTGRRVAYTELRGLGLNRVATRNVDGSGERQELTPGMAPAVSQDGRFVLSRASGPQVLHPMDASSRTRSGSQAAVSRS